VTVGVKSGLRFDPPHFLLEAEFGEERPCVGVGQQGNVIVPVPNDVADTPGAGEPPDVFGALEKGDVVAVLGKSVGKRQAEEAAADDGPTTTVRIPRRIVSGGDRAPPPVV
jgi:hypothetical protein